MTNRELFRVEDLPTLQNRVYSTPTEARNCELGNIILVQDSKTGLIYNSAFDPSKLEYDENYQNEQAYSISFQQHLNKVADIVTRYTHGGSILEVGCGKGRFINILRDMGHKVIGVDPAYQGDDHNIYKVPFTPELGLHADVLVLRHVLEHIPSPINFLKEIARSNGGAGILYIEVPCFDWIMTKKAWFDIYYEHVNYFRIDDLLRLFGSVHESGHLFGGQYIYIVADINSLRTPTYSDQCIVAFPDDFLEPIGDLTNIIRNSQIKHHNTALWGASSKGVIFALYMQKRNVKPLFAIDINPEKQNKYLPASGIHVRNPEDAINTLSPDDIIIVMNSNYLSEIIEITNNKFTYRTIDQ
jgi:SAM-dependent methyltransferase